MWRVFGGPRQPRAVELVPGVRYAVHFPAPRDWRQFKRDERGALAECLYAISHRRRALTLSGAIPRDLRPFALAAAVRQARWEAVSILGLGKTT